MGLSGADYGTATFDSAQAGTVASEVAAQQMLLYVKQQQQRGTHTVGQATINIMSLTPTGATGVVEDCGKNQTYDVKTSTGQPVEQPTSPIYVKAHLAKQGTSWVVTRVEFKPKGCTIPT